MPTFVNVMCHNCSSSFPVSLKRFNESNKKRWNFFCSKNCLKQNRLNSIEISCSNSACKKVFLRENAAINKNCNFCSQSCAATVNNHKRKGKYIYHLNGKSYKPSKPKICANINCQNIIPRRNVFCSHKCRGENSKMPIDQRQMIVINEIKMFVLNNNRIPLKNEKYALYMSARKAFGTWNKAIIAAGYNPNPVKFAKKHFANDGHKCDSLAEKIIDDWLFTNNIKHEIHPYYPNQKRFKADFKIGYTFIEFFGLSGELKKYDELAKQKLEIILRENIKLIKIYPHQLFPTNNLHEILVQLQPENRIQIPAVMPKFNK